MKYRFYYIWLLFNLIYLIKIYRRNINNFRYADDTTLMAEVKRNERASWWTQKKGSEKVGLKVNIQKAKIMVSGPITPWKIEGETVTDIMET